MVYDIAQEYRFIDVTSFDDCMVHALGYCICYRSLHIDCSNVGSLFSSFSCLKFKNCRY